LYFDKKILFQFFYSIFYFIFVVILFFHIFYFLFLHNINNYKKMVRKHTQTKKQQRKTRSKSRSRKVTKRHRGGSPASDRVMSFVKGEGVMVASPETPRLQADVNALKLYQLTGGARRSRHTKRSKRSKRSRKNKRGGGSTDFRDTLYSRKYDGGRTDEAPFFNAFTSEEYISPQDLVNEPNMVANPPFLR
jgi:hypothetical protein